MIYQLTTTSTIIIRLSDGAHIPNDPRNRDYKDYLEWVNEGNTPLPAPAPAPPPPNYIAFWNALLTSNVYGSIRTQSFTSLPMNTLATEFIALIGDAKAGYPNETAIQSSMSAIFGTGTFTEENVEEFNNILTVGHLDDIYSLSIPTP
jgi:hypothetical protein